MSFINYQKLCSQQQTAPTFVPRSSISLCSIKKAAIQHPAKKVSQSKSVHSSDSQGERARYSPKWSTESQSLTLNKSTEHFVADQKYSTRLHPSVALTQFYVNTIHISDSESASKNSPISSQTQCQESVFTDSSKSVTRS